MIRRITSSPPQSPNRSLFVEEGGGSGGTPSALAEVRGKPRLAKVAPTSYARYLWVALGLILVCLLLVTLAPAETPTSKDSTSRLAFLTSPTELPRPATSASSSTYPNQLLCIVGTAESVQTASSVADEWPGVHSFWSVWGQSREDMNAALEQLDRNDPPSDAFTVFANGSATFEAHFCPLGDCPWKKAIEEAIKLTERRRFHCDYFFIMTDDKTWRYEPNPGKSLIRGGGSQSGDKADKTAPNPRPVSPSLELQRVLHEWRPAVASFPSKSAQQHFEGVRLCAAKWGSDPVAPVTYLDHTVGVYHASIIKFMFPLPPNGEDGFTGGSTLPGLWINMFISQLFPQHNIQINTIQYDVAQQPLVLQTHGARLGSSSELTQLTNFEDFLTRGFKKMSWGGAMGPNDVDWTLTPGSPPFQTQILSALDHFYDFGSPAIAPTLKRWEGLFIPRFRIVVFTYNRVASLTRLLKSITDAMYGSQYEVCLEIHVDFDPSVRSQLEDLFKRIRWTHGTVEIKWAEEHKGLKKSILEAWIPQHNNDFAIMLEDDTEVSPYFFTWATACVKAYAALPEAQGKVLGCSLYRSIFSQVDNQWTFPNTNHDPFLLQEVSSWGAVYFPQPWRSFLQWMTEHSDTDPLVPNSLTNLWPRVKSWKKYLIRMTVEKGMVMVFPNLPGNLTLSTNHLEPGTNDKLSGRAAAIVRERLNLPLLSHANAKSLHVQTRMLSAKAWSHMQVFDFWRNPVESVLQLPTDLVHFDTFTVLISADKESVPLLETMRHYHSMTKLVACVCLVWNSASPPPASLALDPRLKIFRYKDAKVNNRLLPLDGITTFAVFSVDAGVMLDAESLALGHRVWQQSSEAMVGFPFSVRTLVQVSAGKWEYRQASAVSEKDIRPPCNPSNPPKKATEFNVALLSAAFFHSKYLSQYSNSDDPIVTAARTASNSLKDGEDIAFALSHSRLSGKAIVVAPTSEKQAEGVKKLLSTIPRLGARANTPVAVAEAARGPVPPAGAGTFYVYEEPRVNKCVSK